MMSPGLLAQIACILEATARKPGNVHRFADFAGDAHYLDFLLSAAAIAEPIDRAVERGVGATVLAAVEATRQVVSTNTNLGILLLIAPLACVPEGTSLRDGIGNVLDALTVDDARAVYQAIRLARPGGLGSAGKQDIANEPTVTLLDAMRLAADRDLVARQYATGFRDVFSVFGSESSPERIRESTVITAFVASLAANPDTLIARKLGREAAEEASRRAVEAIRSGDFASLDAWLRADGHSRNPGATADLIAAALFAALRDGTIKLPLPSDGW
jgi:triphosphoribosyl-dephospho-CoA synthase